MSPFPFWYSQISLPIQYTHKKEVLVWNTSQPFDKKHCTLSLMVIWAMILFQREKTVSIHLGKPLHLSCTSGNQCSPSSLQLQVPDEHGTHPLRLGPFAFLMELLRGCGTLITLCSQNTATSSIGTAQWQCSVGEGTQEGSKLEQIF